MSPDSRFVFGTMRLDAIGLAAATDLVSHMLARGVRHFHTSAEYASYPVFCEALPASLARSGVEAGQIKHMVKLASPHYGENEISPEAIRSKIDRYRSDLAIERLDRVQWMLRHDLKQEQARLDIFNRDVDKLSAVSHAVKHDGSVRQFGCFPYTAGAGLLAVASGIFDFMAEYVNPGERTYEDYFVEGRGIELMAIRPFGAGKCLSDSFTPVDAVRYALGVPGVAGVICSPGSIRHFEQISVAF